MTKENILIEIRKISFVFKMRYSLKLYILETEDRKIVELVKKNINQRIYLERFREFLNLPKRDCYMLKDGLLVEQSSGAYYTLADILKYIGRNDYLFSILKREIITRYLFGITTNINSFIIVFNTETSNIMTRNNDKMMRNNIIPDSLLSIIFDNENMFDYIGNLFSSFTTKKIPIKGGKQLVNSQKDKYGYHKLRIVLEKIIKDPILFDFVYSRLFDILFI